MTAGDPQSGYHDCPEGYYCPEGTGLNWQPCPKGTYGTQTNLYRVNMCKSLYSDYVNISESYKSHIWSSNSQMVWNMHTKQTVITVAHAEES